MVCIGVARRRHLDYKEVAGRQSGLGMDNPNNVPVAVRFNQELFAYETFDNEVVVLQTVDGTYYAFGGSAVNLWEDLVAGRPIARIISVLKSKAQNAGDGIADMVTSFIEQILQEQIMLPVPEPADGALRIAEALPNGQFAPPTFEKHVDMQDLLTLDPIHDVDLAKGWPHT